MEEKGKLTLASRSADRRHQWLVTSEPRSLVLSVCSVVQFRASIRPLDRVGEQVDYSLSFIQGSGAEWVVGG